MWCVRLVWMVSVILFVVCSFWLVMSGCWGWILVSRGVIWLYWWLCVRVIFLVCLDCLCWCRLVWMDGVFLVLCCGC